MKLLNCIILMQLTANIDKLFKELLLKLKPDDSLIFYYSGHGFIDNSLKEGYWLPFDAGLNENVKEKWISNSYVIEKLNQMSTNQIFLLVDSCFYKDKVDTSIITGKLNINNDYFYGKYNKRVRQIINSGALETSAVKSEFSEELLSFFRKSEKSYVDPAMIFLDISGKIKAIQLITDN